MSCQCNSRTLFFKELASGSCGRRFCHSHSHLLVEGRVFQLNVYLQTQLYPNISSLVTDLKVANEPLLGLGSRRKPFREKVWIREKRDLLVLGDGWNPSPSPSHSPISQIKHGKVVTASKIGLDRPRDFAEQTNAIEPSSALEDKPTTCCPVRVRVNKNRGAI